MTKRLLTRFSNKILTTIYFILLPLALPSPVFAVFCTDPTNFSCLNDIFSNLLMNVIMPGASIALFIMLLSGGLKWLTSSGDPKDIESAKGRITFAILGIFLMILAWFILNFIYTFTGVNVTLFHIPS